MRSSAFCGPMINNENFIRRSINLSRRDRCLISRACADRFYALRLHVLTVLCNEMSYTLPAR